MLSGARTPPTEPLKSVSPVKTSPSATKAIMPFVWPGVWSVWTCEPAGVDRRARLDRPRDALDEVGLARVDEDLDRGVRLDDLRQLDDVVVVVVGEQDVRGDDAVALGRLEQRLDRTAGVDEEGVALSVAHEVRVGQEIVGHAALEDHGARS